jgi:hypothetical protein
MALGASRCPATTLPDGRVGTGYGIDGGEIVLVPANAGRPRVVGVVLESSPGRGETTFPEARAHGIWLSIRP